MSSVARLHRLVLMLATLAAGTLVLGLCAARRLRAQPLNCKDGGVSKFCVRSIENFKNKTMRRTKISDRSQCPDSWQLAGDFCVRLEAESALAETADAACGQIGAELLRVDETIDETLERDLIAQIKVCSPAQLATLIFGCSGLSGDLAETSRFGCLAASTRSRRRHFRPRRPRHRSPTM